MKYKGEDIDLRNGDIILFRSNFTWSDPMTFLSAAIRFLTRSFFNHCAVVVQYAGFLQINEALADGVVSRPLEGHLDRADSEIMVLRPRIAIDNAAFTKRATSKVGIPYDYSALILFQLLYRLTGIWIGKKYKSAERCMVCSEYAAWCYDLPGWWYYSVKELMISNVFDVVYYEGESGVTQAVSSVAAG